MSMQMRISMIYFAISALWIMFSDALVALLFGTNPQAMQTAQTLKGWFYVAVSTLCLYWLIRYELRIQEKIKASLEESEARFRDLFINNPHPMWVFDPVTLTFTEVNKAAEKQYGYTPQEFLSRRVTDLYVPDDTGGFKTMLEAPFGTVQTGLRQHRRKDGVPLTVEVTTHRFEMEGRPAFLMIAQDVTAREFVQNELQRTTSRLQSLLQSSPLSIYIVDTDWIVKFWSPASEALFGWTAAEVYGKPLPFVPEDKLDEFYQLRDRALAGEKVLGVEIQRPHRNGTKLDLLISISPLYNDPDHPREISEVMCVMQDVTEYKRLQAHRQEKEQLQQALDREIELRKLRSRFISLFSHEFRNPLTGISTAAAFLSMHWERMPEEDRLMRLDRIGENVQRLVVMLDDLFASLKSEASFMEFRPEQVMIVPLVQKIIQDTLERSSEAIKIQLHAPDDLPSLEADPRLLGYALDNLISNAVKYSPDGGTIEVRLALKDHNLIIEVKDEGIGIPAGDLPHLFELFHRADNVGKIPGTGLGLVIVWQAMELHGGKVEVHSVQGAGATFTLSLPLHQAYAFS